MKVNASLKCCKALKYIVFGLFSYPCNLIHHSCLQWQLYGPCMVLLQNAYLSQGLVHIVLEVGYQTWTVFTVLLCWWKHIRKLDKIKAALTNRSLVCYAFQAIKTFSCVLSFILVFNMLCMMWPSNFKSRIQCM